MTSLELIDVRKAYGSVAVLGVSLSMEAKEFVAFLGPSGSGKSTLLRIIAGLEALDGGEVRLDGRRIDRLPPGERGVAMVFQHYALYPHMTVRENMAFGLRNARVPKAEIEARVAEAARVLEIGEQLDRKPGQMSGGQRQRVAIGRAIEGLVGEEMAAAFTGQKPVGRALADAERRVNELLAQID